MQITLSRHGRPLLEAPPRIPGRELRTWYARYNAAGIDPDLPPPSDLITHAGEVAQLMCSNLRRSIESARAVAPGREAVVNQVFREADLPTPPAGGIKLGPHTWGVISRIGWLAGRGDDAEPVQEARVRARQGAEMLIQAAAQHGSVLLAGHGFINIMIARVLRARGWSGPRIPTRRYWNYATYRMEPER